MQTESGRLVDSTSAERHSMRILLAATLVASLGSACARPIPVVNYPGAPSPVAAACSTTPPGRPDTLVSTVYATTGYDRPAPAAVRRLRDDILRAVMASYSPPPALSAPMLGTALLERDTLAKLGRAGPVFDGELVLDFDASGRLQGTRVLAWPDVPELMPALRSAVLRADSVRALPSFPSQASRESNEVRIRLFGTGSQLLPPVDSGAAVVTVAEPRFAVLRLDQPALAISGSGAPIYPWHLKQSGVTGATVLQFVVDAAGHGDPESIRTVFTSHPDFATAVIQALPKMRFVAGRIAGCPAPSWVRMKFEFILGD